MKPTLANYFLSKVRNKKKQNTGSSLVAKCKLQCLKRNSGNCKEANASVATGWPLQCNKQLKIRPVADRERDCALYFTKVTTKFLYCFMLLSALAWLEINDGVINQPALLTLFTVKLTV